jgi:hypothetical protein
MRLLVWLIQGCLASCLVATFLFDRATSIAILFGMLGPLAAVAVTWVLADRTARRDPRALTGLMIAGFGGKLVFFGTYVTVMLKLMRLRPVPFVSSFTSYLIVLYLIEALYLRRLFLGRDAGIPIK